MGVDIKVVPKYWVQKNRCNCHPETCSCGSYNVYRSGGRVASCFNKEQADELCKHLNGEK